MIPKVYIERNTFHSNNELTLEQRTMRRLLTADVTKLIILQQSYIRRFLAIRHVHRMKFREKCLMHMRLSPPNLVEYNNFNGFQGGDIYHDSKSSFISLVN